MLPANQMFRCASAARTSAAYATIRSNTSPDRLPLDSKLLADIWTKQWYFALATFSNRRRTGIGAVRLVSETNSPGSAEHCHGVSAAIPPTPRGAPVLVGRACRTLAVDAGWLWPRKPSVGSEETPYTGAGKGSQNPIGRMFARLVERTLVPEPGPR